MCVDTQVTVTKNVRDPNHPANRDWERLKKLMTGQDDYIHIHIPPPAFRDGLDGTDPEAIFADLLTFNAKFVLGYPVACGQGIILPGNKLSGWRPEDFSEARMRGLEIGRICNLTPDFDCCSIADFELGALTATAIRTFCIGRNGHKPRTSTVYASLDNWSVVGRATRGVEPHWAFVADWPNYPNDEEINHIREVVYAATRGKTRLGCIQYRSDHAINADLDLAVDGNWLQ